VELLSRLFRVDELSRKIAQPDMKQQSFMTDRPLRSVEKPFWSAAWAINSAQLNARCREPWMIRVCSVPWADQNTSKIWPDPHLNFSTSGSAWSWWASRGWDNHERGFHKFHPMEEQSHKSQERPYQREQYRRMPMVYNTVVRMKKISVIMAQVHP
jgi:hypothetical protein